MLANICVFLPVINMHKLRNLKSNSPVPSSFARRFFMSQSAAGNVIMMFVCLVLNAVSPEKKIRKSVPKTRTVRKGLLGKDELLRSRAFSLQHDMHQLHMRNTHLPLSHAHKHSVVLGELTQIHNANPTQLTERITLKK